MTNPFDDLMGQAKKMQEQMQGKVKKMQDDLVNTEHKGESGAGMVQVVMNGRHDVKSVSIDASLMTEDKVMLEELFAAAVNDAVRKVETANKDKLVGMAPGMSFPDGLNPFKTSK
ncbi:MAG: YbaB/EbfC family nucleoid-associated protein [Gammaproteobacteria bacterium]|nr:YbaB/EbfC family nucleoid-associated protein [Gammaproteobacteria bacterium]